MDKSEGKDWFAKTLNSVTEETAKVYKISRFKFELGTINKSKNEKLNLMGRKLLDYIKDGKIDPELFEPEYSTIINLENKKNKIDTEIEAIKGNIKLGFGRKNHHDDEDDEDEDDKDILKIIDTEDLHIQNDDEKTNKKHYK